MFQDFLDKEIIDFDKTLDREIHKLLIEKSYRIAVAESMTGGLLSHRLMHQPGSSAYFVGGIVCYDNLVKINLCGVSPKTIRSHGVVSNEVVQEMLTGVTRVLNADIGLAVSGVAGPPDSQYNQGQVGTVCIGVSTPERNYIKKLKFSGEREQIIGYTVTAVFGYLKQILRQ